MKRDGRSSRGLGPENESIEWRRNRLSGVEGDRFNAILSAVGMNFTSCCGGSQHFCAKFSAGFCTLKEQRRWSPAPKSSFSGSTKLV